jgi:hypothetical protein
MILSKAVAVTALALATSALSAPAAAVWHYEIFDAGVWSQWGTTTFLGAATTTVALVPIPCSNAVLTLDISGGVASVQSMTFAGSSACVGMTSQFLPWAVSAPIPYSGGRAQATVTDVSLKFSQPTATCAATMTLIFGNVNPYLGGPSTFTFTSAIGQPCMNFKSTGPFYSTKPIRVMP